MVDYISSLGAGSGLNTSSLVQGLVGAERAPAESRLNTQQEKFEAQISSYGVLKSALSTFTELLSSLANNDTFNARSIAFPTTDLITPNSLAAGTAPGTYQITVEDVAESHSLAMPTVADKNAAIGMSGTLTVQFGTWTYSGQDPQSFTLNDEKAAHNITVESTDTLVTLAEKFNDTDSGLQASVISIDGQFQLLLTAPSGADNSLRITSDDASLSNYEFYEGNFAGPTQTQIAADAIITVNGLTITRQSNEINDVIEGFDFTLNKESPGEKLTFTVEADKAVAEQSVRDFVEGYNELFATLNTLTGVSKDPDTNATVRGGLYGDGSAKALFGQLRSLISQTVPGVVSGFNALTNIGIRTELDGTISIEEGDFKRAFESNFELMESLFATTINTGNAYVDGSTGSFSSRATPGSYDLEITTDPTKGAVTGTALIGASWDASDPLADYSFVINVNGTESSTIELTGNYTSVEEIRSELQTLINGDSLLQSVGAEVDVSYDPISNNFTFTSREFGASSNVSFSVASSDMANLGVTTALVGTAGVDVVGTLAGEAGFGSGNVLLPSLDSGLYGLNFSVRPGANAAGTSSIEFSRGFAGGMSLLIERFLATDGLVAQREERINTQLEDIAADREELDRKMEQYEARISAQFLAMEQIISNLNSTSSSLDGILERLPFTASNK